MKKTIATAVILNYDQQILQKKGTIDAEFNRGKINAFYHHNRKILDERYSARDEFIKAWCQVDEDGKPKHADPQNQIPLLLEGKSMEDFNKEMLIFLNTPVRVEL